MTTRYLATRPQLLWGFSCADRDCFRALGQTFIDTAPAWMTRLRLALGSGATADISAASHGLKGMTQLVGADAMTALLQEVERRARADMPMPPLTALEPMFMQVMQEVAHSTLHYAGGDRL